MTYTYIDKSEYLLSLVRFGFVLLGELDLNTHLLAAGNHTHKLQEIPHFRKIIRQVIWNYEIKIYSLFYIKI